MLMLSRKSQEWITIIAPNGDRIRVLTVLPGNAIARVGIEAPREYTILRSELENKDTVR